MSALISGQINTTLGKVGPVIKAIGVYEKNQTANTEKNITKRYLWFR